MCNKATPLLTCLTKVADGSQRAHADDVIRTCRLTGGAIEARDIVAQNRATLDCKLHFTLVHLKHTQLYSRTTVRLPGTR